MRNLFGSLTLALILALLGCTTPQSLLENSPQVEVITTLAPKDAVSHILTQWQSHNMSPTQLQFGEVTRITVPNQSTGGPVILIDVSPHRSGSLVRYYEDRLFGIPQQEWKRGAVTSLPAPNP
jgi:hypothetical protein